MIQTRYIIPLFLSAILQGQSAFGQETKYRLGVEWDSANRTSGTSAYIGIPLFQLPLSLVLAHGSIAYHNIDTFPAGSRARIAVDYRWTDVLLRYDFGFPNAQWLRVALEGGLERITGTADYTFGFVTATPSPSKDNIDTWGAVLKPSIYLSGTLLQSFQVELGLGLHLRSLAQKTYEVKYPDGQIVQTQHPPELLNNIRLILGIAF